MEAMKKDPYQKVTGIVIKEINSVDRLHSMFELGMRLDKGLDAAARKTFGIGCGGHCDAWGIACGNHCLQGLDLNEEMIRYRYAIDVLGSSGLTDQDMALIQKDFVGFHKATTSAVTEKLSLSHMDERIQKYSKKV